MPAGISPLPPIKVQMGFASTPLANPQTWTDISSFVRKIDTNRGKQHILDIFQPGRITLLLNNRGRDFDPSNSGSAFYPNVDINKQIQIQATWNLLSAAAGGATMSSGWTAVTNCAVSYSAGQLVLTSSAAGNMTATTPTGISGFVVSPGQFYSGLGAFKAAVSARACRVELLFYDSSGTAIGSATLGTSANDNTSTFTPTTVGATAPSNAAFGALRVTVLATGAANEVHKLQQCGVMPAPGVTIWEPGGPVNLYTGFVESITPEWSNNVSSDVILTATDALRLFNQGPLAILPGITAQDLADSATQLWLLNDLAGSGTIADSTTAHPFTPTYSPAGASVVPGGGTGPAGSSFNATQFDGLSGFLDVSGSHSITGANFWGGAFSVEIWFNIAAAPSSTEFIWGVADSGSEYIHLGIDSSGHLQYQAWQFGTGQTLALSATAKSYADGAWHQAVITCGSDAKTTALYVDGALVSNGVASGAQITATQTAYIGCDTTIPFTVVVPGSFFGGLLSTVGFYQGIQLSATQVTNHFVMETNGTVQQQSGARITALLAQLNWPTAWENIATGDSPVQATSLAQTTPLTQLQAVELAEHGWLFVDVNGTVTFINRTAILKTPRNVSLGIFGDAAGEIAYLPNPKFTLDNVDLYNAAAVQRLGGVSQSWSSAASISRYGVESLLTETGLLVTTDAEALSRAQWDVAHFAYPLTRVRQIDIDPNGNPALRYDQVIFRELVDRVTVHRRPYARGPGTFGSPTFSQDYIVEGINHSIDFDKRTWKTSYMLTYADTQSYWILGDATFGVLDTSTRLAY